jgi:hypothetical protein
MICTVCCATKRRVEIACPDDCVYLASSIAHPPAVVQRRQQRDLTFLLPLVAQLTETQTQLLALLQSVTAQYAETAVPSLLDEDVAAGAGAAAATLETARKGIIYEHQPVSATAQRYTAELRRVIAEIIAHNSTQQARVERDAAAVLRVIEQAAGSAAKALEGDEPPVFLNLLERMMRQADRPSDEQPSSGPASSGNLIIEP